MVDSTVVHDRKNDGAHVTTRMAQDIAVMSNLLLTLEKAEKQIIIAEASYDAAKLLKVDNIADQKLREEKSRENQLIVEQRRTELDEAKRKLESVNRELRTFRRSIRRRLFKIRNAVQHNQIVDPEYDGGLKAWFDLQLDSAADLVWVRTNPHNREAIGGFTFDWDISAREPLKVIRQFAWDGQLERRLVPELVVGEDRVQRHTGRYLHVDACDPAAFTRQP